MQLCKAGGCGLGVGKHGKLLRNRGASAPAGEQAQQGGQGAARRGRGRQARQALRRDARLPGGRGSARLPGGGRQLALPRLGPPPARDPGRRDGPGCGGRRTRRTSQAASMPAVPAPAGSGAQERHPGGGAHCVHGWHFGACVSLGGSERLQPGELCSRARAGKTIQTIALLAALQCAPYPEGVCTYSAKCAAASVVVPCPAHALSALLHTPPVAHTWDASPSRAAAWSC